MQINLRGQEEKYNKGMMKPIINNNKSYTKTLLTLEQDRIPRANKLLNGILISGMLTF